MPIPKIPKAKVPPLSGGNTSTQRTRIGDTGFDPRFDERVKEQQRLNDLTTTVEKRSTQDVPNLYLPDYEGHGFVSSMSDRTAAGGTLTGINDVQLKRPINLRGGQDYMFENPGQVWASAEDPVRAIMMQAAAAKALTGKDPLLMNWRMAPTGGDFAHMTGETMLSFAESNMGKGTKRSLDKEIKQFIPDWKGIDSPDSIAQYRELPDAARKALKAAMDKTFRNEGGLGIGEARLSVADPQQINASEGYLMNVGRIFADKPIIEQSGHPSYPKGVPGEGVGRLADDRSLFELNPKVFPPERDIRSLLADPSTARSAYENLPDVVTARGIPDPREPRQADTRALQMKPYYGILTEDILRGMGYAQGGLVDSAPEEAIKNTITDPQAFRMLDMDLANLALMNQKMQPRRIAGGGAVHMDKGGKASKDDIMNLKPQPKAQDTSFASVRSLLADIGSNQEEYERIARGGSFDRRKFTPENIYAMRLLQAANATPDPARYLESLNPYLDSQLQFELNPYTREAGYVSKSEPNKVVIQRLEQVANTIPHELTHTLQLGKGANPNLENNTQAFARARGLPADMKSSVFPSTNVTDMTELWANINARAHEVNAAGGDFINSPEGRALFPTNTEQRDYYTNAMPGVNSITPDTGTFVPNNQTLLQRAKKSLGFADGGQAQRFDEGGEVSQSELDRMRFELAQAQNPSSPVMQATPRSPVQDFIGTAGGYMDRAGKFVSEAIAPTAEKNPVKHFLADILLASPLKGAGTLMQDLTGTVRETNEDNPVRGVVSKDWGNLNTSTEPLLDPRVLDIAQFGGPAAKVATKLVRTGAKALTPFAKSTAEMAAELYTRGQMPGMVAPNAYMVEPSVPKPSRVLAPANEQGFYSPTEAAALNLQRKTGNGQAFLNDILKQENVRAEEVSGMGLDTFLKDKKNVTAAEVQDYIAQNKLGLGEAKYGELSPQEISAEWNRLSEQEYGKTYGELYDNEAKTIERMIETDTSKFKQYSLPGGENYREVVLTLPSNRPSLNNMSRSEYNAAVDAADKAGVTNYQSSHFDEPNVLAHLRMSDRVTDGKKTLLVDEVQSDWHQAGREQGYAKPETARLKGTVEEQPSDYGFKTEYQVNWDDGTFSGGYGSREIAQEVANAGKSNAVKGVPNAPYKDDWYQLALKRAVKEAIDGGYDRVALPTGARVAERFDLSKQVEAVRANLNPDGTYQIGVQPIGKKMQKFDENVPADKLASIVGKDLANKITSDVTEHGVFGGKVFEGLDLKVGGEGMKKYYDEIYPTYLKKFGKKYDANVGMTSLQTEPSTDQIFKDGGKYYAYTGQGRDTKGFKTYAEALNFLGIGWERIFYMDITPAMRKEFSTGIHMAKGGKVSFADSLDAMRHELTQRQ